MLCLMLDDHVRGLVFREHTVVRFRQHLQLARALYGEQLVGLDAVAEAQKGFHDGATDERADDQRQGDIDRHACLDRAINAIEYGSGAVLAAYCGIGYLGDAIAGVAIDGILRFLVFGIRDEILCLVNHAVVRHARILIADLA